MMTDMVCLDVDEYIGKTAAAKAESGAEYIYYAQRYRVNNVFPINERDLGKITGERGKRLNYWCEKTASQRHFQWARNLSKLRSFTWIRQLYGWKVTSTREEEVRRFGGQVGVIWD